MLLWNPDALILGGDADLRNMLSDPSRENVSAVQNGRAYQVPTGPYNWLDQPPPVQRVLALKWLGNVLYPEIYDYDIIAEAQRFYALFWHCELTENEAKILLGEYDQTS